MRKRSIKEVLADILLELPDGLSSQDIFKIKHFIQKACEILHVSTNLIDKICKLPINSSRAFLPDNVYNLKAVWVNDSENETNTEEPIEQETPFTDTLSYDTFGESYRLEPGYSDGDYLGKHQYYRQGDVLFVGDHYLEDIYIKYTCPETDEEGYWLINANEHVNQAIYWYIVMKLLGLGKKISNFTHDYALTQFERIYSPRAISANKKFTTEDAERALRWQTSLFKKYDKWNFFGNSFREDLNFELNGEYNIR